MTLRNRSYQKELLDGDGIPFADIQKNMQELNTINSLLGGHDITIKGFKQILGSQKQVTVCEIGCGGGDNLVAIQKWCEKNSIALNCIGIDMKEECVQYARSTDRLKNTEWIVSDYEFVNFAGKPDIIFSSLFCHHFKDEQLINQLQWMRNNCKKGFFINDLQRNPIAYYSIALLTKLFSSSYLVKNDAPLSVARGFTKKEWSDIAEAAGMPEVSVEWKWAFRYLVSWNHGNTDLT